jgi:hypothetical protein
MGNFGYNIFKIEFSNSICLDLDKKIWDDRFTATPYNVFINNYLFLTEIGNDGFDAQLIKLLAIVYKYW